jgi:Reverse transcriptase (RNA-dependent DNA polymerase)
VFYRHFKTHITILALYMDDIIIIRVDNEKILRLKKKLRQEFEVKDLGLLKYFLDIKIMRSPKRIMLS